MRFPATPNREVELVVFIQIGERSLRRRTLLCQTSIIAREFIRERLRVIPHLSSRNSGEVPRDASKALCASVGVWTRRRARTET
jgi:hypothetical protein